MFVFRPIALVQNFGLFCKALGGKEMHCCLQTAFPYFRHEWFRKLQAYKGKNTVCRLFLGVSCGLLPISRIDERLSNVWLSLEAQGLFSESHVPSNSRNLIKRVLKFQECYRNLVETGIYLCWRFQPRFYQGKAKYVRYSALLPLNVKNENTLNIDKPHLEMCHVLQKNCIALD